MSLLSALGLPAAPAATGRNAAPSRPAPPPATASAAPERSGGVGDDSPPPPLSPAPRARGAQGAREATAGQGELIGNKGVLVFDFASGQATLTPNQERVLLSQQVKFSSREARLRVIGHSSSEEDPGVAQQRAAAVAAFLKADPKHPVPDVNILEVKGVGSSQPVAKEGTREKPDLAGRKRNRSVQVTLTTSEAFVGEPGVGVSGEAVDAVNKSHPAGDEQVDKYITEVDFAAAVIATAFEGTVAAFAAEFVAPALLMLHVAVAWEEAAEAQARLAFSDGLGKAADAGRMVIAKGKPTVAYADIESASMPRIDAMAYFPATVEQARDAAQKAIHAAAEAFAAVMRKVDPAVRRQLEAKGLKGAELEAVFGKVVVHLRSKVAYELADALKVHARGLRKGG